MLLKVVQASKEDVYRDVVRVPEMYRKDSKGQTIPEGTLSLILVNDKSSIAILRGNQRSKIATILIDEKLRNQLGLSVDDENEFEFKKVGLFDQFHWAWQASDPAYRIAARMGLLALMLGAFGFIIGILAIFLK